ncbi:MAG: NifB/NifX family molybdenum-iron cluster-binding protein [Sulfurimonas sp.]|jgi:predicted Fe-Mo cluster-binding NifX family protein
MIVSMPVKTASADAALAPLFGNAKYFAFANDNNEITIEKMEQNGGRDVARILVANNVDVLITSHLGLNPFVLLKSYGIKVYFAGHTRLTATDALKLFHANELVEVTSENFDALLGEHDHHGETHDHSHGHTGKCCGQHSHI